MAKRNWDRDRVRTAGARHGYASGDDRTDEQKEKSQKRKDKKIKGTFGAASKVRVIVKDGKPVA